MLKSPKLDKFMENKPQNSPTKPLENGESRNMASYEKDEKSELISLAKENLDYTKLIYKDTQKIRRFMFWRLVINIIWIILIIAPAIVAIIWLPPLLNNLFGNYADLFGNMDSINSVLNDLK
jgi:hypothetical protein